MFLHKLSASDSRFKTVHFQSGLNILVADRTASATAGDSRNGTGKSSLTRILRYMLGGNLAKELKDEALQEWTFHLDMELPSLPGNNGLFERVRVNRTVSPQTRVTVSGWSVLGHERYAELHIDEWREYLGRYLFDLPEEKIPSLTPGSLWSRLIRDYFESPTKSVPTDSLWATGLRVGHLLGLDTLTLSRGGQVLTLERQRKALRQAISEGALQHLDLDEAKLRSDMAGLRRRRSERASALEGFRVDIEYEEHQKLADSLSARITKLNDEALTLRRRLRELDDAMATEDASAARFDSSRLQRLYDEMEFVLPEQVTRRYDEVSAFHQSVVRNRRTYLENEHARASERLSIVAENRAALDIERAEVMQILQDSIAFSTFSNAQQAISALDAEIGYIERRMAAAAEVNGMDTAISSLTAETTASMRAELREAEPSLLEGPLAMFDELGSEIYDDRRADLLLDVGKKGALTVEPLVSGDASDGIRAVETFLLDTVLAITGMRVGKAPPLLVHDSHLFDPIDARQIGSCLNVGARLSDEWGYQYVVTMNSDLLSSVASEGSFESEPYVLDTRLTDEREDGGLFGFKFG